MYKHIDYTELSNLKSSFWNFLMCKNYLSLKKYSKDFFIGSLSFNKALKLYISYYACSKVNNPLILDEYEFDAKFDNAFIKYLIKYHILDNKILKEIKNSTYAADDIDPIDDESILPVGIGKILCDIPCISSHIEIKDDLITGSFKDKNNGNDYLYNELTSLCIDERDYFADYDYPICKIVKDELTEDFENTWCCKVPDVILFNNINVDMTCEYVLYRLLEGLSDNPVPCKFYQLKNCDKAVFRYFDYQEKFSLSIILVIIVVFLISK